MSGKKRHATALVIAALAIVGVAVLAYHCTGSREPRAAPADTVVITYAPVTEAEPNDALPGAQPVSALPAEVHGQLTEGDRDFYRLPDDEPGPRVLDAWIEDLDGARLEVLDDHGHVGGTVVAPGRIGALGLTRGPIFLAVSGPPGTYRLRVVRSPWKAGLEREPNDDLAHAQVMSADPHGSGELARFAVTATWSRPGDIDCFVVPLAVPPAGAMLRVALHPPADVQPKLRVTDGGDPDAGIAPRVLAEQTGAGPGQDVVLPALGERPWERAYVICTSAEAGAAFGQHYRIEVVSFTPDGPFEFEPNDTPETASGLPRDLEIGGYLGAGDVDWFRISSGPDHGLDAELRLPAGVTATLALLDEQHRELATARGGGQLRATAAGPAFVRVTTVGGSNPAAPYRLSVRPSK